MYKIIGAKVKISNIEKFLEKINSYCEKKNIVIQVFNADMIFGDNHLVSAYEHAKRAFEQKTNTTNTLAMEILLYASGERQLKLAIPKIGIKKGQVDAAFIIIGDKITNKLIDDLLQELSLKRNDKVLEGDINTLKKFGLKESEIKTVSKDKYDGLILEKIALVDIIK
ncbi:MAG: KEOPS complex subunit Cgi121 [Epsilonproteobacteria bacterium]|nr:KEOPS complex subunit Cgi121 [Campylobacterota bacterium]